MSAYSSFEKILDAQCEAFIQFFAQEGIHFSVICAVKNVAFSPPLPQDILDGFQPLSLFILAGYTFESLEISKRGIIFEAGFGRDNIGSFVQIDFRDILQIVMTNKKGKDIPVFTRLDGRDLFECTEIAKEQDLQQSMEAILSNPHNKKFFS